MNPAPIPEPPAGESADPPLPRCGVDGCRVPVSVDGIPCGVCRELIPCRTRSHIEIEMAQPMTPDGKSLSRIYLLRQASRFVSDRVRAAARN